MSAHSPHAKQAQPQGAFIKSRNDIGVAELPIHRIGEIVYAENTGLDDVSMSQPTLPGYIYSSPWGNFANFQALPQVV